MISQKSKRGSMLIVAMFLLVFLLVLGGGLLQWGMLNVDASVNARSGQQAYYAAKSALDSATTKMTEEAVLEKIDETLKDMGQNSVLNHIAFSQDAGLGVDVDESGNPLLTMKMTCTERPADIEDGTQKFVVTATATCGGYSRSVSKEYEVTRVPPGGAPGLISTFVGADVVVPGRGALTVNNSKVLGGTHIQNKNSIAFLRSCTIAPPVNLYTGTLNLGGSGLYGTTGAPSLPSTQSGPVYINANSITYGSPVGTYYGEVVAEYGSASSLAQFKAASKSFQDKPGAYSAQERDLGYAITPKEVSSHVITEEYISNNIITQSSTVRTTGYINGLRFNTGGKTIDLFIVPQNAGVTSLEIAGNIICEGGGTVNIYSDVPTFTTSHALSSKLMYGVDKSGVQRSNTKLNIVLRAPKANFKMYHAVIYASIIAPHAVVDYSGVEQTGILWGGFVDLLDSTINAEDADASSAVPGLICKAGGAQKGSVTAVVGAYQDPKKVA